MKIPAPAVLIALASLFLVLALVLLDFGHASPGPLNPTHSAEPDLRGSAGCVECHADGARSMANACAGCHAEIASQLETGRGLHGTLADADAARCAACHAEHHADEVALVAEHSFARAGVEERASYDHAGLAFGLDGRHAALTCVECHPLADVPLLSKGERRFLGLESTCSGCHDDPHAGDYGADCASCHGQQHAFDRVASFEHAAAFPLAGSHAGLSCVGCHTAGSEHAIGSLLDARIGAAGSRDCDACHASPHAELFLAEALDTVGGTACDLCHDPSHADFSEATMGVELHAATGFPLELPHEQVACETCHVDPLAGTRPGAAPAGDADALAFRIRYPGRRADDCAACHGDPHGGQFESLSKACLTCHEAQRFTPATFTFERHASSAFALDGAHEAVGCFECHTTDPGSHAAAPPAPTQVAFFSEPERRRAGRVFRGAPQACDACHVDVHDGYFARESLPADVDGRRGCARCHDTEGFDQARWGNFGHATWTGFELAGAHARADCEVCHVPQDQPDAVGRRFGRVADVFGRPSDVCSTCHDDVHRGAFAAAPWRASCDACHDVESFRVERGAFDHARWTGFALAGAHAEARCESCHRPSAAPLPKGRRLGFVADVFDGPRDDCATCHVDVHRGFFEERTIAGRTGDCTSCHGMSAFDELARPFEHARWTGWELSGAHADADCKSCHVPEQVLGLEQPVFGRARATDCAGCHADPHVGQFASDGRTDCARCHTSTRDFRTPGFDHARDTRFALDEQHAALECSACHVPQRLQSGELAVRYKPLGTLCGDCHDPRGPEGGR